MRLFKLVTKLVTLACFLSISSASMAAPFVMTFTDTVEATSTAQFNSGELFNITIVVDNGGATTLSQTWTPSDIVSVRFDINNAPSTITTVLSPVVFTASTGNFVTDAAGVLTAVPSELIDDSQQSTIQSTNDNMALYVDYEWYINGLQNIFFDLDDSDPTADMTNPDNNIDATFWSAPVAWIPPVPTSVPTLSQWSMILLTLMLLAVGFVKTRRFK